MSLLMRQAAGCITTLAAQPTEGSLGLQPPTADRCVSKMDAMRSARTLLLADAGRTYAALTTPQDAAQRDARWAASWGRRVGSSTRQPAARIPGTSAPRTGTQPG